MTFFESLEQETSLPSFFVTRAVMWAVCALHTPNLREPHPTKLSDCAPSCPACLFCGGAAMWDARLHACLEDGSTWGGTGSPLSGPAATWLHGGELLWY